MATGGGHSQLKETMSVVGVPVMTKSAFVHSERSTGEWWHKAQWLKLGEKRNSSARREVTIPMVYRDC